ncbi:MAG: flagellar brake protein [Marinobacterium sp.]|nr:flagellar brake protein [Marinobacterium sp.]
MTTERQPRFEDLKLQSGLKLQLDIEDYSTGRDESVLLGYSPGQSVIVSAPLQNGAPIQVATNTPVTVRFFSHQLNGAGAFRTRVIASSSYPYPHMHLSMPEAVVLGEVRKALRARVELEAILEFEQHKLGASITDISVVGARIEGLSDESVLAAGDQIRIYSRVTICDVVCKVRVDGIVRNISVGRQGSVLGVEFIDVNDSTRVLLHGYTLSQAMGDFG